MKEAKDSYLLYWWHRLDEEDFVQFTICVLDQFTPANSDDFTLVFDQRTSIQTREKKDDILKEKINSNMGRVGDGVINLSYVSIMREIETWENSLFEFEEKMDDMEDEEDSERTNRKKRNLKKRISSLELKIEESKKVCLEMKSKE